MPDPTRPDYFLQSLERGLIVLRAFDADHPDRTLTEAAEATGLGKATVRRILLTFVDLGYMRQRGRRFALTPRVLDLGFSYLSSLELVGLAEPHLQALSRELGESVLLAVLDDFDVRYIARATAPRPMHVNVPVGGRSPAHVTSAGRILLSDLNVNDLEHYLVNTPFQQYTPWTVTNKAEFRSQIQTAKSSGWSNSADELDIGMGGVAVLVPRVHSPSIALSTVFPTSRFDRSQLESTVVTPLRECAEKIASSLRGPAKHSE
ncbi:IclR family transcriptional regulator C-terminal domain-containing protein [Brevibacterium aurantiacum]|uniref:Helix-turn-helix domain-containing protein n=1 Tax=Brevibacterium aurantiacum TaxID=273384 RepID=A0A556C8Z0_BREAU|nr:IclR family transcriptional regulator C-terminal domain-containing protein [Brevibacterium aurantiacum]TSI13919.1 helix-turn-helix domain-containing protein [Brevibacterium aurantiacum]